MHFDAPVTLDRTIIVEHGIISGSPINDEVNDIHHEQEIVKDSLCDN